MRRCSLSVDADKQWVEEKLNHMMRNDRYNRAAVGPATRGKPMPAATKLNRSAQQGLRRDLVRRSRDIGCHRAR